MDIQDLSMRDIATIEKLSQMSISQMGEDTMPKGRMLAAMYYVTMHKEDDEFTFDMALDTPMSELNGFLDMGAEDEEDESKSI